MHKYSLPVFFSILFLIRFFPGSAKETCLVKIINLSIYDTSINKCDTLKFQIASQTTDSIIANKLLSKKEIRKKKVVSAIFSFPFPFGFMGAHRVMLGTKPWVPIVYMATFGGCFGLLPAIDFVVLLFSKDIEQYENNPRIFMWLK